MVRGEGIRRSIREERVLDGVLEDIVNLENTPVTFGSCSIVLFSDQIISRNHFNVLYILA